MKYYNLNVTEVRDSDFKNAFTGIFNFTVGILFSRLFYNSDESDSSSALSDGDLEEENKEDGISEDELEFLKRDAERHNLDKQGSRPSRRKRSPVRRKAKIETDSEDEEEAGPSSSSLNKSPKKSPKTEGIKKEKKTEVKKKEIKKEAGSRADNSQDKFPFESASNEEPSEESPKKKSPAKKVKSPPKKTIKKSPKKEEVKKEASSPKTKPIFGQKQTSSAKTTDYDPTKVLFSRSFFLRSNLSGCREIFRVSGIDCSKSFFEN